MRHIFNALFISFMLLGFSCGKSGMNPLRERDDPYETAEIRIVDKPGLSGRKVKDLKYFVSNDTLYMSELFHSLFLSYNWDESGEECYSYIVYCNYRQKMNTDGWYMLKMGDVEIPRIPTTHISALKLLNFVGQEISDSAGAPIANAILYDMISDKDLSPELSKLLPYIQ